MRRLPLETIDFLVPIAISALRVLLIGILGYLAMIVLRRLVMAVRNYAVRASSDATGATDPEIEKRVWTLARVGYHVVLALLWVALAIMALQEAGFKIDALLAGAGISAGVIGVAVGFGAQTVVKDLIAGVFMLFEDQVRVNDVVVVNGTSGTVQELTLRSTVLRLENGALHIFPNGSITSLSNLTYEYAYYVFEIVLNYAQDSGQAMRIMQEVAAALRDVEPYTHFILADLEMSGVDRFGPSGLVIKARLKTRPGKQWIVGREMNRRMYEQMHAAGIDLSAGSTSVKLEGREELKAAVREVLEEMRAEQAAKLKAPPPVKPRG